MSHLAKLLVAFSFFSLSISSVWSQDGADILSSSEGEVIKRFINFLTSEEQLAAAKMPIFSERLINKFTTEGLQGMVDRVQTNEGGLILYDIVQGSDETYDLIAKSIQTDGWLSLKVWIPAADPELIDSFQINMARLASPPSTVLYAPPPTQSRSARKFRWTSKMASSIKDKMQQQWEAEKFSGVVLVAEGETVLFEEVIGLSDRAQALPNMLTTKFNVGSINKAMTGIAILQLVEQGKLQLDDPITKHLTGFADPRAEQVSILHLLTHTSGWGMFWDNPQYLAQRTQLNSLQSYFDFLKQDELAFDPGSTQQYSNTGYLFLGCVIEQVTGLSYYDYVARHIFEPAGMTQSGYQLNGIPDLAKGYTMDTTPEGNNKLRENLDLHGPIGTAAGGGYATAQDLLRFALAIYDFKLLSAPMTGFLLSGYTEMDGPLCSWGIAGGAPGINAELIVDHKRGVIRVVMANLDPPAAEEVSRHIRKVIRR